MLPPGRITMNGGILNRKSGNILLVEDNPVDVLMTRKALEEGGFGFTLYVAEDGEEALDFLRQTCSADDSRVPCPDLILLDINLPRKNGKEVLAHIKQDPRTLQIPVIILTTSDEENDVWECYSLYANCYITKPVDAHNFTRAVQCIGGFWTKIAQLPPS
jgi:two-component system, chemotaxis family, response regulator Rcp1